MTETVFAAGVLAGLLAAIVFSAVLLAERVEDCTQASSYRLCVAAVDWSRAPMAFPIIFVPAEVTSND